MATFCAFMAKMLPHKEKVMQGAFSFEPARHLFKLVFKLTLKLRLWLSMLDIMGHCGFAIGL